MSDSGRKRRVTPNDWGDRLSKVLDEHELSIRQAAKLAGVSSPSVLDNWLKSSSPQDLVAVARLCDKLEVDFRWLLTGSYSKDERRPRVAEMFREVPFFEGLAKIRIDRLIPADEIDEED